MAAYAALVSLFNDLQLIPNHLIHSFSFDDKQLSSLSQTVEFLIDFMESYDSHGCTREATEALESRIATAAHAAHDVIQSHVVDQILAGSTRRGKVRSYFLLDLQKAMDNMEFVKRKTMQFKAKSGSKPEQPTYSSKATTSSEPLKNAMVGFDEVVLRLMEILIGEPSDQRLVIPIAGMGGLGKTSLAKTVYEHSFLEHHFDVRLWATISQQYSAQSILTELLKISTTAENVSELGEELRQNKLWNRRYLIVLDDMWSLEAWNEVKMYLPENGNGSRVVVTTRLSDLAARLSSSPSSPFKLNFLDEDKSWELFCGKTFGEEECPVELEEIGKKIVKRCRGLPLTIVVIGGHLRKSSWTIEYWEKVAGYMDPISSIGEEKQCLEILSLSYQYLPAHLKPCFLYLATFKEDEVFGATTLLQYWVAEGFLKPKEGLSLEKVGEDCLKDLVDRNLIIFVHEDHTWRGEVKYYRIHDTMRELCLKACKKEKFLCGVEDSTQATIHRERRLMILEREKFNSEMIGAKQSAPPLYSLVNKGRDSFLNELLVDCKLLRVLVHEDKDADDLSSTCLPLSHVHQVNLRALAFNNWNGGNFSKTAYSILSSISAACWNFQTLRMVMFDPEPIILPYEIWEMPQLRHIQIEEVFLPDPACCPGSTQQECIVLQNLHTLGCVVNLRLTEEVCKRMPNLKELHLRYDHLCDDYCFHNLGRFNKLKCLLIRFDNNSTWRDVLQSLTFPTSLEVLWLIKSHLRWEDLTIMISSLPLLEFLQVMLASGSEWNLDKEEFYCLKTLDIVECRDLISLNANPANFPVLETLYLRKLPKLSAIPLDIGEIPTLRRIELTDCSTSAAVSAMKMVIEQETSGNSDLQLYVYFWEHKDLERFQEMLQEECLTSNSLHLYYQFKKIKTF